MDDSPQLPKLDDLLCFNVYALHHSLGRFYHSAFGDVGFTYAKFVALLALNESGPMSLSALSAKTGVEANSLSPLIKKMASFELVERVRDPEDERRIQLAILPFGRTILERASKLVEDNWAQMGISPEDIAAVTRVLAKTKCALDTTSPRKLTIPAPGKPED